MSLPGVYLITLASGIGASANFECDARTGLRRARYRQRCNARSRARPVVLYSSSDRPSGGPLLAALRPCVALEFIAHLRRRVVGAVRVVAGVDLGFGILDLRYRGPVTVRTDFRLASRPKRVTVMAIMLLIQGFCYS
jgi:CubicO group peptidase (beta-lactamase class C family)